MNPDKLPAPQASPEYQVSQPSVELQPTSPETTGERSHEQERQPAVAEQNTMPVQAMPLPAPLPVVPVPAAPVADDTTVGPTIAADDDLIEKEWVDKAKKIIAETKDDPFRREQEVSRLQADYLRKRYGKELGVSN